MSNTASASSASKHNTCQQRKTSGRLFRYFQQIKFPKRNLFLSPQRGKIFGDEEDDFDKITINDIGRC